MKNGSIIGKNKYDKSKRSCSPLDNGRLVNNSNIKPPKNIKGNISNSKHNKNKNRKDSSKYGKKKM